ncbi:MAG: hypothetical protein IPI03_17945 [Rubrivivax sp.]|nr:hypothetical protein [Rubrivivax sp.]MBK7263633.1 hypothetical protein [Rubrivivax sp.]MBK8526850.1 hypothetical protein [Rubrivivax sp.]
MTVAAFTYSIGRSRWDNMPVQRQADTLRAFAHDVLSHRAVDKGSAGYISAASGNDGRRASANALPRAWLPMDVDGIDADAHVEWRLHLTRYRGFGWPTASSTPEAPRERVIIELSEPVDRHQGIAIGALLTQDIEDNFGTAVRIDPCTFRAEQPCFLALQGVRPFYLLGDALDVPTWLEQVPEPPAPPPPPSIEAASMSDARMRYVVDMLGQARLLIKPLPNGRGYAMHCPWAAQHTTTDAPGSCATALLFPAELNGWMGTFKCLHSHCATRRLGDLLAVLRAAAERTAA